MTRPIVPLLALVALAALVRAQMAAGTYLINQDSPGYLQPARDLRESGVRAALAWPGAPHPAYPMLIAGLWSAVGNKPPARFSASTSVIGISLIACSPGFLTSPSM